MPNTSTHHYDDGTHRIDYTVLLKPRLKHRYIRIHNGKVIVTAAIRTSEKTIEAFVASKISWIIKHLDKNKQASSYDLARSGTQLYWHGELHGIEIQQGEREQLTIASGIAYFTVRTSPDHSTMLSLLHRYRKEHAPNILLPRIRHWSNAMDLHPTRISFRRARTRWGSCSSHNAISLNTHLLILPDSLIDYVIVHELAHIRHKHHQEAFWSLVSQYIPEWKEHRKSIRAFEKFLL